MTSVVDTIGELARLEDGWAGPGSVKPGEAAMRDFRPILERFPAAAKAPAVEVDEEDGTVLLRWTDSTAACSLSLVFRGTGRVVGIVSRISPPTSALRQFSAADVDGIVVWMAECGFAVDDAVPHH